MKSSLPSPKGIQNDDLIGIGAKADGTLILYAYCASTWFRLETKADSVEEPGVVIVSRTSFFRLLAALKDETTARVINNGARLELKTASTKSKFTLGIHLTEMPKVHMLEVASRVHVSASRIKDQLNLSILQGEVSYGGYNIKGGPDGISIKATDKLRFIMTSQKHPLEEKINLTIGQRAIVGVFEILKLTPEQVELVMLYNQTAFKTTTADGDIAEYGYANTAEAFPDMSKLLNYSNYPNTARFEVADLLQALERASALASDELPAGDFDFSNADECTMTAFNKDGTAEMGLHCTSDIEDAQAEQLALRLSHLKGILQKAKECGASFVLCSWGSERAPVKWSFDYFEETEERKYTDIEMVYMTAALNRGAIARNTSND